MSRPITVACAVTLATLAACSSPPRVAQNKLVQVQGKKLEFGGTYAVKPKELRITVNGDAVMQGRFSQFSPTLTLNAKVEGIDLRAECYFGSVLGNRGGVGGIVANAVQGAHGKGSDSCQMLANEKAVETLYF